MIEIRKNKELAKELFPNIEILKKWNTYSVILDENDNKVMVTREPNNWYKLRASIILPFIFIPYCFYYGYINVKNAIRESFKGKWIVEYSFQQEIVDKVKDYIYGDDNE